MGLIRIRLILTSKEVLSVKGEDLLFLFMQGFTLPGHNHLILLVLRRTSNHSLNLSPIVGKRLNRSSCRSYINVSSTHHRVGIYFLLAGALIKP